MYVVTFYSFKGGVGRSMALVNVAAELAKNGRRVLIVDFDLEAPGLTHFGLCPPETNHPGVVEFVSDYMKTGEVQDIQNYVLQSKKFPETEDRLWIMPAGCQNDEYQSLFSNLNWQDLYDNHQGYLLMEDMRSQWDSALQPDYVFIDSRTGYTDISGICTRQLPDAVCLLFTPNKQNLNGLTQIVSDIKSQNQVEGLRHPRLHFVASNIPNLDDDEKLLEKALGCFSQQLSYVQPSAIIHHYSSFALINEAVFTLEHPKSQLSGQYRSLAQKITEENRQDKFAVINFLTQRVQALLSNTETVPAHEIDLILKEHETTFSKDVDVLFLLARYRRLAGDIEQSFALLNAAIQLGLSSARAYIERAIININRSLDADKDAIWEDLEKVLRLRSDVRVADLVWVIRLAFRIDRKDPNLFIGSPALDSLGDRDLVFFLHEIEDSLPGAQLIVTLTNDILSRRKLETEQYEQVVGFLGNALIALGQLEEAKEALRNRRDFSNFKSPVHSFNYGMAEYWSTHINFVQYFNRVIEQLSDDPKTPNLAQCLSFAYWAIGDKNRALASLEEARLLIKETKMVSFSCWRYLDVTATAFESDLHELEKLYSGERCMPLFLKNSKPLF